VLAERVTNFMSAIDAAKSNSARRFLDPSFAANFFELRLPMMGLSDFTISRCETKPIRLAKNGGKSIIEFTLHLKSRVNKQTMIKTVIGKWRQPDRPYDQTFALSQELWRKGFEGGDHLGICEPIAYFSDLNVMLMSKVAGVPLGERLVADDDALKSNITQVARWLLKLHKTNVTRAKQWSLREEEVILDNILQNLVRLDPLCAERLRRVLRTVLERERSVRPESFVLIHGDLHPNNIFVDGLNLSVIDLDRSCLFDRAKDLGYFLGQVNLKKRRYKLSVDTDALRKNFLNHYTNAISTEVQERIAAYQARTYVEHLNFLYWTLKKSFDPVDVDHWLHEAEECLQRS